MPPHPFSLSENQVTMNRRWCIYPSRTSGGRLWPTVPYIVIQIQHRENMLRLSSWYFVNTMFYTSTWNLWRRFICHNLHTTFAPLGRDVPVAFLPSVSKEGKEWVLAKSGLSSCSVAPTAGTDVAITSHSHSLWARALPPDGRRLDWGECTTGKCSSFNFRCVRARSGRLHGFACSSQAERAEPYGMLGQCWL